MEKWNNETTEELWSAICALENKNEAKKFFRDLLTPKEIIEFSKRWQVARMLNKKVSYSEIEKRTGLSSTTVARVSQWLNRGMGGYKLIISRFSTLHHNQSFMGRERL